MQMKEADFDDVIATNLKGAFNTIRQVYPLMVPQAQRTDSQYLFRGGRLRQRGPG